MSRDKVDLNDLLVTLEEAGVEILTRDGPGRPIPLEALIGEIVEDGWPSRLRSALLPLFLARRDLAARAPAIAAPLSPSGAFQVKAYYTAAVYTEARWRTRLEECLGPAPTLEDHFSGELGLPPPSAYHGILGLRALAGVVATRLGDYNFLSEFEETARLFMETRERGHRP